MNALARLRRPLALVTLGLLAGGLAVVAVPSAAQAHPLGNTSINHFDAIELAPDAIVVRGVSDIAEIPTLQRRGRIDTDGDTVISAPEATAYAISQCADRATGTRVAVASGPAALEVTRASYAQRAGVIGLEAGRLECDLRAAVDLTAASTVTYERTWDSAGAGWHEITATGDGVTLVDSPFPAQSISNELAEYPEDLLSSPLDVRSGELTVEPGSGVSSYAAVANVPGAGPVVRALEQVNDWFTSLVGAKDVTIGVAALAFVLAMVLGAGHAFLPGHGKTIMAAYLVGRGGRIRDVVAVGATVTATHTASVLVLGLLIGAGAAFTPNAVEQSLAVAAGLIVLVVGLGLLWSSSRRVRAARAHARSDVVDDAIARVQEAERAPALVGGVAPAAGIATHAHAEPHTHAEPHGHGHSHGHGHGHSHGPGHTHDHGFGRGGLLGLGFAGGLVPSPSALLVLLAAIGLGRTTLGVVLVLAYGLGMAVALCAAGLLLVAFRARLARTAVLRRLGGANRLIALAPLLTAALVIVVGLALTLRAASGVL